MKRFSLFLYMTIVIILLVSLVSFAGYKIFVAPRPSPSPEILWDYWLDIDPNGGRGGPSGSGITVHFHPSNPFPYVIPSPGDIGFSNEGYQFKQWNDKADGTGKAFNPGDSIDEFDLESTTLYAIWEK